MPFHHDRRAGFHRAHANARLETPAVDLHVTEGSERSDHQRPATHQAALRDLGAALPPAAELMLVGALSGG